MKIIVVLEHFYPYIGGVEFLFWQLTNELVNQGHQVKVITTRFEKKLPKQETINGVHIQRVNSNNRFSFIIKSLPAIIKASNKYDLIHTTTYTAALPSWLVAKIKNKKSVLTFHEYWGDLWYRLPYLTFIQKILFKNFEQIITHLSFTKVVAVSEFTKNNLLTTAINPSQIKTIYNGLDYQYLKTINDSFLTEKEKKENRLNYLFVGRLGVSKGINILLDASQVFLQQHPEATLTMVIPKQPKKLYKQVLKQIKELNNNHQLLLKHNLSKSELYKEMQKSSFIVIPSYAEGFCFVAAEACALNVPVVSSQKGALKEVVSGKFIAIQENSKQGLLTALEKAKNQEWQWIQRKEFPLKKSVQQYVHLYKELIHEP